MLLIIKLLCNYQLNTIPYFLLINSLGMLFINHISVINTYSIILSYTNTLPNLRIDALLQLLLIL